MLRRKIYKELEDYLVSDDDRIMILEGARQIGKSYAIRSVGKKLFTNFVEINLVNDDEGDQLFRDVRTTEELYLLLGSVSNGKLGNYDNTLIFIDEIQHYRQFFTMLKFLREEHRYHFITSGSMLGIALRETTSIPVGSLYIRQMAQLDFEEFLMANGITDDTIEIIRQRFQNNESLPEAMHKIILKHFRRYLLVGGMPDAVNAYVNTHNIVKVRNIQKDILRLYADDASKYEQDSGRKLMVRRLFDMIPSQMENKKKRIVAQEINGTKGDRMNKYIEEFEYLISAGVVTAVHAISNPKFPLCESLQKNLLKLYHNDVGLLTAQLYGNNISPLLNDERSVNIGAIYECVVAQELRAHGHKLFYYDNKQNGEVDFLIDDYFSSSVLPIEVKSGKDYTRHIALNRMISTPDYQISSGVVFSNDGEVRTKGNIRYLPVYYSMFFDARAVGDEVIF